MLSCVYAVGAQDRVLCCVSSEIRCSFSVCERIGRCRFVCTTVTQYNQQVGRDRLYPLVVRRTDVVLSGYSDSGGSADGDWMPTAQRETAYEPDGPMGRLLRAVNQSDYPPIRSEWTKYVLELATGKAMMPTAKAGPGNFSRTRQVGLTWCRLLWYFIVMVTRGCRNTALNAAIVVFSSAPSMSQHLKLQCP
jgi:hypothetical protein